MSYGEEFVKDKKIFHQQSPLQRRSSPFWKTRTARPIS